MTRSSLNSIQNSSQPMHQVQHQLLRFLWGMLRVRRVTLAHPDPELQAQAFRRCSHRRLIGNEQQCAARLHPFTNHLAFFFGKSGIAGIRRTHLRRAEGIGDDQHVVPSQGLFRKLLLVWRNDVTIIGDERGKGLNLSRRYFVDQLAASVAGFWEMSPLT